MAAVLIGGALLLRSAISGDGATSTVSTGTPATTTAGPGAGAVDLLCAPEAETFCRDAAADFNGRRIEAGGRTATVSVSVAETAEAAGGLARGTRTPGLWLAPASYWVDRVNTDA